MATRRTAVFERILVAAFSVLTAASAGAQAELTGALRGTVTDTSGSVLPGVSVTTTSPALVGGSQTVLTSAEGAYRFPRLAPGEYSLRIALPGFRTIVQDGIRLNVGQ